jgi:hypothetical protein
MSEKIRVLPTVRVVEVGEESILLNVETGKIHALNETAGYVWRLLQNDGPLTIQEIQNLLKHHYEVSEKELDKGITELMDDLQKRKLIEKFSE